MLIKLSNKMLFKDEIIYVNPSAIVFMATEKDHTIIYYNNDRFSVRETPEEIMALIDIEKNRELDATTLRITASIITLMEEVSKGQNEH